MSSNTISDLTVTINVDTSDLIGAIDELNKELESLGIGVDFKNG